MITLRNYTNQDYSEVRKTLELVKMFDSQRETRENLEKMIQRDPESILVALDDKNIIGSVYVEDVGWDARVFRLAVRKEFREKGVGSLLLAKAEEILKGRGHVKLHLFVHEDALDHLQPYYEKRGYTAIPYKHQCFVKRLK